MIQWIRTSRLSIKNSLCLRQQERHQAALTTLEATQGQIDGFFSQIPYKCH